MTIHKCDVCGGIVEDAGYKSIETGMAVQSLYTVFDVCYSCIAAMGYDPARVKFSSDVVSLIVHSMKIAVSQCKPQTKKED